MTEARWTALLTWPCPDDLLAPLRAIGTTIERLAEGGNLREAIRGKDALLCYPLIPVDAAVVAAAQGRLRVVSTCGVGYDNIDLGACRAAGIAVGNTPGVVVEATADITYALILCVMRGIISGDRFVRAGDWMTTFPPLGRDLKAATLGIVGMGAIGSAVAQRAKASGMRIVYHNRRPAAAAPDDAEFLAVPELLGRADCVVVLAPLTEETRGMFNRAAFARMKRGAFLVNAARGPLVDTAALHEALASGHLAGAAVDVVEPEPLPADHPLLRLPNFFVTPHIGTATFETRGAMARLMVANAVAGLRGEPLPAEVL